MRVFFVVFVALVLTGTGASACNLSSITLCGLYKTPLLNAAFPADSMICITVCNGYGRTGTTKGADNDTRSISFGWYTHRPIPAFTIRAFTPASITSGRAFTNCTMTGSNIGPQGPPYNSRGTIIYIDPGYYGITPCVVQPFGCVTSTALCGPESQQCITYRFQVNKIPDSVRVFGVEGGGNPIAGCYPNVDMRINFVGLAVEWGAVDGFAQGNAVKVKWSTLAETNTDMFIVERLSGGSSFSQIGTVPAAGYSSDEIRYEFTDLAPMPGDNLYRIVQVDKEGNSANSQAIEVSFSGPAGLVWGSVGPNPASDFLNMTFYNDREETMQLSMRDLQGKTVIQQDIASIDGSNSVRLALDKVDAGAYFVTLQGANGKLTRKIVKL